MPEGVVVVEYDREWPTLFDGLGERLRAELGDVALRIDHIGSTAVVGLAAKPVIDVQISVSSFEPLASFRTPLERAGFVHQVDNPERTKRYFREQLGARRTHIHVRRAGSFSEQFGLLFREYLRAHASRAEAYAALKRSLAIRFSAPDQRQD
ncbi:MAG: GrpB family protein, partial [Actinomycetota bacterium]